MKSLLKTLATIAAVPVVMFVTFGVVHDLTKPEPEVVVVRVQPTAEEIAAQKAEQAAYAARIEVARQARIEQELASAAAISAQAEQQLAQLKGGELDDTQAHRRQFPSDLEFELHDMNREYRRQAQKLDKAIDKFEETLGE